MTAGKGEGRARFTDSDVPIALAAPKPRLAA